MLSCGSCRCRRAPDRAPSAMRSAPCRPLPSMRAIRSANSFRRVPPATPRTGLPAAAPPGIAASYCRPRPDRSRRAPALQCPAQISRAVARRGLYRLQGSSTGGRPHSKSRPNCRISRFSSYRVSCQVPPVCPTHPASVEFRRRGPAGPPHCAHTAHRC